MKAGNSWISYSDDKWGVTSKKYIYAILVSQFKNGMWSKKSKNWAVI